MKTTTKIAIGIAVVVGYVLGRLKKGRWALALAAHLAGRSLDPRELLSEAVRTSEESVPRAAKPAG